MVVTRYGLGGPSAAYGTFTPKGEAPVEVVVAPLALVLGLPLFSYAQPIVPSDTVDNLQRGPWQPCCQAIHVGSSGVVPVVWPDGAVTAFTCVTGQLLFVRAIRVNQTGCTASALVALYRL